MIHKEENKPTYPQDIHLNQGHRIIVISGPNAGGKSITLKTVGLLQLMLQSGMLIPVHERSRALSWSKHFQQQDHVGEHRNQKRNPAFSFFSFLN